MASRDFLLRIIQDWSQPTRAAKAYAQAVKREMAEVQQTARTSGTAPDLVGKQAAAEAELVSAVRAGQLTPYQAGGIRRAVRAQFDAARQEIARAIGAEVARPSRAQLRAAVAYNVATRPERVIQAQAQARPRDEYGRYVTPGAEPPPRLRDDRGRFLSAAETRRRETERAQRESEREKSVLRQQESEDDALARRLAVQQEVARRRGGPGRGPDPDQGPAAIFGTIPKKEELDALKDLLRLEDEARRRAQTSGTRYEPETRLMQRLADSAAPDRQFGLEVARLREENFRRSQEMYDLGYGPKEGAYDQRGTRAALDIDMERRQVDEAYAAAKLREADTELIQATAALADLRQRNRLSEQGRRDPLLRAQALLQHRDQNAQAQALAAGLDPTLAFGGNERQRAEREAAIRRQRRESLAQLAALAQGVDPAIDGTKSQREERDVQTALRKKTAAHLKSAAVSEASTGEDISAAAKDRIAKDRRRRAVNEQTNAITRQTSREGTPVQRLQQYVARRTGQIDRPAADYQTGPQLLTSKAITTAGFALSGALLYGAVSGIRELVREAEALERELNQVEAQFDSLGQGGEFKEFRGDILAIARETGHASDEVAHVAFQMKGAFRDTATAVEATNAAMKIARVTGLQVGEIVDSLTATALNFGVSVEAIGDAALGVQERTGVLAKETITAVADLAPVAKQVGLTLEQTFAVLGVAQQSSGRSGTALAEAFGRILPAMQKNSVEILGLYANNQKLAGSYDEVLNAIGSGNMGAVLDRLVKDWDRLTQAEQDQIITSVGGRREAAALIAVLGNSGAYLREVDAALQGSDAGKTAEYFSKLQETVAQAAARLGEQITQLGEALFRAGLAEAFKDLIRFGSALVTVVGAMVRMFATMNEALGGLPGRVLLLVGALRLLLATGRAVGGSGIGRGIGGVVGGAGGIAQAVSLARRQAAMQALINAPLTAAGTAGVSRLGLQFAGARGIAGLAGRGLLGAFGGPVGLAATAAITLGTVAYSSYRQRQDDAKQKAEELRERFRDHREFNRETLQSIVDQDAVLLAEEGNKDLKGRAAITAAQEELNRQASVPARDQFRAGVEAGLFQDISRRRLAGRLGSTRRRGDQGFLADEGLSKEELEQIVEKADAGNAEAIKMVDGLIAIQEATAKGKVSLQQVVKKFGEARNIRQLNQLYTGEEGAPSEAASNIENLRQQYEAGQVGASGYLKALNLNAKGLRDVLRLRPDDTELLKQAADNQKQINSVVGDLAIRSAETQLALAEIGGTGTPQQTVAVLEGLLRNPQIRDPKDRQDLAKRIQDAQKQILDNELALEESAIQRARIAREGIPLSAPTRIVQLEEQLNTLSLTWGDYLTEVYGSIEAGGEATRRVAEAIVNGAVDATEAALAEIRRQRAALKSATSRSIRADTGSAVGGNAEDLVRRQAADDKAIADEDARLAALEERLGREGLGVITPPARSKADPAEQVRLDRDAQREREEELKKRNDYLLALIDLEQARAEADPIAVARLAIREADLNAQMARDAGDAAGELRAAAQRIRAENQLKDAITEVFEAQRELAQTTAELAGDTVGAARIGSEGAAERLKQAIAAVRGAGGDPEQSAEVARLRGEAARAEANVRNTDLEKRRSDIDFFLQMEQITTAQAIAQLEALLQIPNITQEQTRELLLKIKSLKESVSRDFTLGDIGEIRLPTIYEVRRQSTAERAGASYQDNRIVYFNMTNNNATDYQGSIDRFAEEMERSSLVYGDDARAF